MNTMILDLIHPLLPHLTFHPLFGKKTQSFLLQWNTTKNSPMLHKGRPALMSQSNRGFVSAVPSHIPSFPTVGTHPTILQCIPCCVGTTCN